MRFRHSIIAGEAEILDFFIKIIEVQNLAVLNF